MCGTALEYVSRTIETKLTEGHKEQKERERDAKSKVSTGFIMPELRYTLKSLSGPPKYDDQVILLDQYYEKLMLFLKEHLTYSRTELSAIVYPKFFDMINLAKEIARGKKENYDKQKREAKV